MFIGALGLATLSIDSGVAGYVASLIGLTAGYALFQAANNTSVMAGVSREQRGVVSGVLSLSRNLGLISGASLMGALFSIGAGMRGATGADPAAIMEGMHVTMGAAASLVAVALAMALKSARPISMLAEEKCDDRA
jgi:hypothetical protein